MAKNKITIDVMVNGKMEKATVSAKKLRKELKNADQAQNDLNTSTRKGYRASQGAAQNTSNSTKAFSKQAGVVGGLVPIYATFAANVFAVSAAFGVLSRAAAVRQLETSLTNIGIAAGKNLPAVAQNLRDITGAAISTEAALRATAIATTSGFSTSQLQGLTKVATGASIALGRSLPDALDRLVRGTAKLEPEILDELGIIVRLDQATREYAASLGKTAGQLTQFERQQAFLNATITQGLSKYEKIAQTVDPNPYDRLAAAFTDLTKASVEFVNKGLIPIIEFLSESPTALFGALGLLSTTIVRQIIPTVSQLSTSSAAAFSSAATAAKISAMKIESDYTRAASKIQTLDFLPRGFKTVSSAIKAGTASAEQYKKAVNSLKIAEGRRTAEIKKTELAIRSLSGFQKQASQQFLLTKKAELAAIKEQLIATQELQAIASRGAIGTAGVVGGARTKANADKRRAVGARVERQTLNKIEKGSAFGSLASAAGGIGLLFSNIKKTEGAIPKFTESLKSLGSAGKFVGAVFGRLLGPVSLALIAFSFASPFIDKLIGAKDKLGKKVEKINESFDESTRIVVAFNKEMKQVTNPVTKAARQLEVAAGITDTTAGAFASLQAEAEKIQLEKLTKELEKQTKAQTDLTFAQEKYNNALKTGEFVSTKKGKLDDAQEAFDSVSTSVNDLIENFGKVGKLEATQVLTSNIAQLRGSGAFETFPELKTQYEGLLESLARAPENVDLEQYIKKAEGFSKPWRELKSAIVSSQEALRQFDAASAKLAAKDQTPFSAAIKASQDFTNEVEVAVEKLGKKLASEKGLPDYAMRAFGLTAGSFVGLDQLEAQIKGVTSQARFYEDVLDDVAKGSIKTGDQFLKAQEKYNKLLVANEVKIINAKTLLAEQENILKRINRLSSLGSGFAQIQIDQEKEVKRQRIATLEATQLLNKSIIKDADALKAVNDALQSQIDGITNDMNDAAREAYRLVQDGVKAEKEKLEIISKQLEASKNANDLAKREDSLAIKKAARLRGRDRTSAFTADEDALRDQLALLENERKRKMDAAQAEADMRKAQIKLEFVLLDAKYKFLAASARQLATELEEKDPKSAAAKGLRSNAATFDGLGKKLGVEVTVGAAGGLTITDTKDGLLSQLLGQVDTGTTLTLREINEEIEGIKTKLEDFDTVEMALQAGFDAMSTGMSTFFTDVINGTKSVKNAFGDLAMSILQSIQKVFADAVAQKFVKFLAGKAEGGFFERFFKKPGSGEESSPSTLPTAADAAMQSSTPGPVAGSSITGSGGLDGLGLGTSSANPVYVTMAQDILEGAGVSSDPAAGDAPPGVASAADATKENTEATEGLTMETVKSGLQTASAVTAGLATVAALTGNEKAAKALAIVTALLQTAVLALTLIMEKEQIAKFFGFGRNGGIFDGSGKNIAGYSTGGIARGSQSGYPALLHGTEAVVPLPNGKSIPVEMAGGGGMQQNNVSVNVVMNSDGTSSQDSQQDGRQAAQLGKNISMAVQEEIRKQKRNGGMLSPYGSA
jgi:hypothetical protein